tara:strand:+ start:1146 stop:1772 length:627 start_codon:yes stop_codon:yes gene_type:complete
VLQGLLDDVEENSSVRLTMADGSIRLEDPRLFRMPFVVLSGASAFAPLSDAALANLRLFLRDGGFLFIDDASGRDSSDFDRCVRRDLKRALPGSPLVPIGRDHAVYRSFFLLGAVSGRVMIRPHLEGVWQGDITPVLYSRNDLFGALWRSPGGGYALDVVPGRERQRGQALRLAINVVLFALTGNYKRDAVHVRALLERMRRQGGYSR